MNWDAVPIPVEVKFFEPSVNTTFDAVKLERFNADAQSLEAPVEEPKYVSVTELLPHL